MKFHELPHRLRIYIIAHVFAVLPLLWLLAQQDPPKSWSAVGALLVATVIFSTWRVELTVFQGRMTLTNAGVCLALLLQGVQAAVLCATVGGIVSTIARPGDGPLKLKLVKPELYRAFFNVANCGISCAIAALFYREVAPFAPNEALKVLLGLTTFTGFYFMFNTLGVAGACALQQNLRWIAVWQQNFLWTAPGFFASASVAVAIEWGWKKLGLWSLLFLPPLWLIYRSYQLYMDRLHLFSDKMRQDMEHIQELNKLNQAIISSLAMAIDAKDRYTCSHINRVQYYAVELAKAAGLTGPDLEAVGTGALVHDIGKLGIPDHILGKPGKLTPEEFRRIQGHVNIGAEILSPIPFPFPVVDVVLTHHERWDGLGYPVGLRGEAIPIGGRIISIVDVFDALTSNRPYRQAMSYEEAVKTLKEAAGKQFDPRLVDIFEGILPEAVREIERMEAGEETQAAEASLPADGPSAFTQISQAAAEMAAVCDVAHSLAEQESLEQIATVVVNRALALLPADTAVLYVMRPDEPELVALSAEGKYRSKLQGMTIRVGEGVAGWVAQSQQPRVNVSAALDVARRFSPEDVIELNAATAVPLVHGPDNLGVLAVYTMGYSVLSEHHLRVLNILAEHAAAAIQNSRRVEEHREMAYTDPLTGLANSRGLVRHMERLLHSSRVSGRPEDSQFSVVMLDVDRFKEVNDTMGHLRGDDLLREIATTLSKLSRPGDVACRYAGDEFVLLLPEASLEQADRIAVRVRRVIDAIPSVDGRVKIGASVGVASFPGDGSDGRTLIHAADRRMYEDKFHRRRMPTVRDVVGGKPELKPEKIPLLR